MFFRRKKAPEPPPPSAPAAAGSHSTQFLTGDGGLDRQAVEVLLAAIAQVSRSRDLESLLESIVDKSVEVTGAERGFLILAGADGGLETRVARGRDQRTAAGPVRFARTVVRRVIDRQEAVRATVNADSESLDLGTSVFDLKLRAVMCVPISTSGASGEAGIRGALYVDSKAATREFKQRDLALFDALSQHISIALENARLQIVSIEKARMDKAMEIASEIQYGLMPQVPNDVPGYDVHGWYRSAERTSGDFYDFVRTRDERLGVVLGDVTGHGIGPALVTASAQTGLRHLLRSHDDLARAVTELALDLTPRLDGGMFVTLFVAVFAPDGSLQALNAGQTPPLVWRAATRAIETLGTDGPALGMMDGFEYAEKQSLALAPGDVLLAFSDGFVEARPPGAAAGDDERFFGESGVRAVLTEQAGAGKSAREIAEAVVEAVLEHSGGEREDDMTIVAVRRR